jgi:hypothetical protein
MGGTGVIDQFLETFTRYIDSGFGLVGNEVGYLASTLVAIDITLAGLFWVWVPMRTSSLGWSRRPCLSESSLSSLGTGIAWPVSSSRALPV